jgi:hypothetical protein
MDWVLGSYTATVASDISSNFIFFFKGKQVSNPRFKIIFL